MSLAIAGQFNAQVDFFQMSPADPNLNGVMLEDLLMRIPEKCVLVLQDIDSAGLTREAAGSRIAKATVLQQVTRQGIRVIMLAGILNAIDGTLAPEGDILIMNTNAPDAPDPALVRAGRVDYKVELSNVNRAVAANIFKRMMAGTSAGKEELSTQAAKFASFIPERLLTPAAIQGCLLLPRGDVNAAVQDVEKWVASLSPGKEAEDSVLEAVIAESCKGKRSSVVSISDRVL